MTKILLPSDLEYHLTLGAIPAYFQNIAHNTFEFSGWITDPDSGLVRPCTHPQMIDYIYGGEYEELMDKSGYDASLDFEAWGDISNVKEFYIDL